MTTYHLYSDAHRENQGDPYEWIVQIDECVSCMFYRRLKTENSFIRFPTPEQTMELDDSWIDSIKVLKSWNSREEMLEEMFVDLI